MKTPELYVGDVLVAIEAIDFAANSLTQSYLAKSKALQRRALFMPWKKDSFYGELLASANFAIARLGHLQSIREKLMQSTGVDEDMRPITLEEILKKNATRTN
jgi:hypothetical protein